MYTSPKSDQRHLPGIRCKFLVAETNEDSVLSATRRAVINRKSEKILRENQDIQNELGTTLGVVLYGTKIILPVTLCRWFLNAINKHPCGFGKMKEESKSTYWPNTDADIHHEAPNCIKRQQTGKNLKSTTGKTDLGKLKPLYKPNQEIQIDHYGPVTGKRKTKYIIVATDRYSKCTHTKNR